MNRPSLRVRRAVSVGEAWGQVLKQGPEEAPEGEKQNRRTAEKNERRATAPTKERKQNTGYHADNGWKTCAFPQTGNSCPDQDPVSNQSQARRGYRRKPWAVKEAVGGSEVDHGHCKYNPSEKGEYRRAKKREVEIGDVCDAVSMDVPYHRQEKSHAPAGKHGEERRGCRLPFLASHRKSDKSCDGIPKDYHQHAAPMPFGQPAHDRHQRREREQRAKGELARAAPVPVPPCRPAWVSSRLGRHSWSSRSAVVGRKYRRAHGRGRQ